jgi:hypothetical protein
MTGQRLRRGSVRRIRSCARPCRLEAGERAVLRRGRGDQHKAVTRRINELVAERGVVTVALAAQQPPDRGISLAAGGGRTLCLVAWSFNGSPSPVQADELAACARCQVIGPDGPGQRDDRAHLGQVLGAVRAARQVRFEAAALRPGQNAFEVIGDQLDSLLAG